MKKIFIQLELNESSLSVLAGNKAINDVLADVKYFLIEKQFNDASVYNGGVILDEKYSSEINDLKNSGELEEFENSLSRQYKVEIHLIISTISI